MRQFLILKVFFVNLNVVPVFLLAADFSLFNYVFVSVALASSLLAIFYKTATFA